MKLDEILAKAQVIRQNLEGLDAIPQATVDEFQADFRNLHAALHLLQTSIQALVDIGSICCASLGLATPRSSHEVFTLLEADGRLPKGTAERLSPMIGFRNGVVHLYDRVDPGRVYEILTRHREDLADWLQMLLEIKLP